jgi:hypothetical protein
MVFGNITEEDKKNDIRKNIMELKRNIKQLNLQIEGIDNGIIMRCIDTYSTHQYERYRDDGPYAESYWICKYCGYEK